MNGAERQPIPTVSGSVLPVTSDPEQLKMFSDVIGSSFGYRVDFVVDDKIPTFATTYEPEQETIQVHISTQLIARFEQSNELDFFTFAVKHELNHVEMWRQLPPTPGETAQERYFANIVDDIADNLGDMRRTRYFADLTPRVYDTTLFPVDKRPSIADTAKHKQFMESLLLLSMLSEAPQDAEYGTPKLESDLSALGLEGIADEVKAALAEVTQFEQNDQTYNLLEQLRVHGHDYAYRRRIARHLRTKFNELYEEDRSERSGKDGDGQGDGDPSDFDYSDSGGCSHGSHDHEHPPADQQESQQHDDQKSEEGKQHDGKPDLDIEKLAKEIANQIKETADDIDAVAEATASDLTPEQLAALQAELDLSDEDFAGYMAARHKYAKEIAAFSHLLMQLKRERIDHFLAPSQEVSARGHRIDIGKLVTFIANGAQESRPAIWKSPQIKEKVEHEFDGLDFYMAGDGSVSMKGEKAQEAAASAVVMLEGLLSAAQLVIPEEALVRIMIKAFGVGHQTLCELTDAPSLQSLGQTYSVLKNPTSSSTHVAGALEDILTTLKANSGHSNRLSVVAVVSDGEFHDPDEAKIVGQQISDEGAHLIQFVYGGATVSKLADKAIVVDLDGARALPRELFKLLPELIAALR